MAAFRPRPARSRWLLAVAGALVLAAGCSSGGSDGGAPPTTAARSSKAVAASDAAAVHVGGSTIDVAITTCSPRKDQLTFLGTDAKGRMLSGNLDGRSDVASITLATGKRTLVGGPGTGTELKAQATAEAGTWTVSGSVVDLADVEDGTSKRSDAEPLSVELHCTPQSQPGLNASNSATASGASKESSDTHD